MLTTLNEASGIYASEAEIVIAINTLKKIIKSK